ncbi:putative metal-dependent hydrolase YjjV [Halomonadaceae bacterium LMG 33818]|uniref:TatD family hydrolase n=1 Tax=Cernens ardua TaxID=3402176 RepID=UPI003EDB8EB8
MLTDAHCHLCDPRFDQDRTSVIKKALARGVGAFFTAATNSASWDKQTSLVESYAEVPHISISTAMGLHPWFVGELADYGSRSNGSLSDAPSLVKDLQALERLLKSPPLGMVAVGECGVDARSESEQQWALFDAQLALANTYRWPVVVHCVRLNDQVAKLLRRYTHIPGGLIHGFAGSLVQAQRFIDQGYLLGIGGAVTFDRAKKLQRVVKALPQEGFVLESDSPDMLPAPLRGTEARNTPASVALVADYVACLRQEEISALSEYTNRNVTRVFGR